jgi:hypothetical protein
LNESGKINYYDIEWPDGTVETNVPATMLEKVRDSDHPLSEAHGKPSESGAIGHGVEGHEEGLRISERRYKKRKYFR